jgi:Ca2+/Na+ antiporter
LNKNTVLDYEELTKIRKKINRTLLLSFMWIFIAPIIAFIFQGHKIPLTIVVSVTLYFVFMLLKCIYFSFKERKILMNAAQRETRRRYKEGNIVGAQLNEVSALLPSALSVIICLLFLLIGIPVVFLVILFSW